VARREVLGELMSVLTDEGRTIFFSSHNTLEVEQISDHIAFIDRGCLVALDEKEDLLDRWRRVRLVVPSGSVLPQIPGLIEVAGTERLPILTTSRFDPAVVSICQDRGATVQGVDSMTLEEIFVANVQNRRELQPV
jgi:ABC-2 type transport system ATP-binding protein